MGVGSTHISGKCYKFKEGRGFSEVPLAPLPTWPRPSDTKGMPKVSKEQRYASIIPDGRRHKTLVSFAMEQARKQTCFQDLLTLVKDRNEAASEVDERGLKPDDDEIHRLCESAWEKATAEQEPVNIPAPEPVIFMSKVEIERGRAYKGFVGRYVNYASQRTDAPAEFHEAVAYALLSVCVGRKACLRLTTGDMYPTLWLMEVADSTVDRKSTCLDLGRDLLHRTGEDLRAPEDFSPQGFVLVMRERDGMATLFVRDEFSGFLEGLMKLEYMSGGKEILIGLHDCRPFKKRLVKEKEPIEIRDPFLSILTAITRERFLDLARTSDITSGFFPRFALVAPRGARQRKPVGLLTPELEQERDRLVDELKASLREGYREMRIPQEVFTRWNQYGSALDEAIVDSDNPEVAGPVNARSAEKALKAAMLLAFGEGSVSMDHLLAGMAAAERWRLTTLDLLRQIAPSRFEKTVQRFAALVMKRPHIKRGQAMSTLRVNVRTMDDLEETCEERGLIRIEQFGKTKKGKTYHPLPTALDKDSSYSRNLALEPRKLEKLENLQEAESVENGREGEI